jgi:autotransporter translocation and assembly factor TamB
MPKHYSGFPQPLPDANATATVRTDWTKNIEGNFQASYRKYGDIRAQGNIRGALAAPVVRASIQARSVTYQGIGPINGSADASLENNIVLAEKVHADLKQSSLDSASLRLDLRSQANAGSDSTDSLARRRRPVPGIRHRHNLSGSVRRHR